MNKIKNFVNQWRGRGYERGEAQIFWLSFLRDVFGVSEPEKFIKFEVPVKLKHKSFIDGFFPDTKVIIEQKSLSESLSQGKSQSDGTILTPYEQAQRYGSSLPYSMRPRWIIVCNFAEFLIYDMETLSEPKKIFLNELPEKFYVFDFLIDHTKNKLRIELELSLKAGEIVGKLYDALHAQYIDPNSSESLASLNKLCVRLVFCLYAESAGIFGKHKIFRDYLAEEKNVRRALLDLFDVLNTPIDARDPYLDDMLKKFPFVNGGLFAGAIEIPNFTPEIKNLLLEEASSGFNWAGISPTIFGAVFESTINPTTRRAGGMHYTSLENIHKVIDPLFLDDLKAQFTNSAIPENVKSTSKSPQKFSGAEKTASRRDTNSAIPENVKSPSKRKNFLLNLQKKLSEIKILDPACGSGNFLTESYISLRRIENLILKELFGTQIQLGEFFNPIKVSISQFYGIEINDFAVSVAQTALWIAELQMIQETQEIIHRDLDFLPLKSYSNIHEGNALQIDWSIAHEVNFIIGNPPFVGFTYQTPAQKSDLQKIFPKIKNLDYVCCWYKLAADFMHGTDIKAAFVSTNSICQGETMPRLWKNLFAAGVHIDFAHRTFRWDSESVQKAHVHCVIVGFSCSANNKPKIIFDGDKKIFANNINGYLLDGEDIFIESRAKHLQEFVPPMIYGNMPRDGGFFTFNSEELAEFLKREPNARKYIYKFIGGRELIYNEDRFCLWLVNCPPNELHKMKLVYERVKNVREFRLSSKSAEIRKLADIPTRFAQITQPEGSDFIAIPGISSERRKYVPIAFMSGKIKASNQLQIVPNANLYHFGILTSSIHMIWLKTVGGRLESRYRYSKDVVYNNFPWCTPNNSQIAEIETTAQKILSVRKNYPSATLADLYDELTMPKDLRDAHKKNDRAVAQAYGFEKFLDDESKIVAELMKFYLKLIQT